MEDLIFNVFKRINSGKLITNKQLKLLYKNPSFLCDDDIKNAILKKEQSLTSRSKSKLSFVKQKIATFLTKTR
jgi:hypothetical protein